MRSRALLITALALLATSAIACGVCVEDKIAATYDHASVMRAKAQGRFVVFAAIQGPGSSVALARRVRSAATKVAGIDRKSIRVATDPLAVSFVLDPGTQTAEGAIAAVQQNAGVPAINVTLLRVLDGRAD